MTDVMTVARRHDLEDEASLYEWHLADAFAVVKVDDGRVEAVLGPYSTAAEASDVLERLVDEFRREGLDRVSFHLTTCEAPQAVD